MAENKEKTAAAAAAEEKPSKRRALFRSRKMRHGSLAVILTAVGVAVVILLNVAAGLLVERYPELKADLTANKAFALSDDTKDYLSRLQKDVKLHIVASEEEFTGVSTHFVQAKNLLDKMAASSNGKFSYAFVDTTANPQFAKDYPNINWKTSETMGVMVCGKQYKGLSVTDCFTYDEDYYNSTGVYQWTGTTIEQAVVKAAIDVTTDNKVIVDVMTGEGESSEEYGGVTALLTDNAYQVNEVSLLTGAPDKDARFVLLFAPERDLSDEAAETLRKWLENDGKYGKTLLYVANADPRLGEQKTPNIDAILSDWGMELNKGMLYETDPNHRLNNTSAYVSLLDYTDYYAEGLNSQNVFVVNEYALGVTIKDENTAHALLQSSDKAGILPFDAGEDFDPEAHITGKPIAVAAEGVKTGTEQASNVVVFSSKAMLLEADLTYPSFNNANYFMTLVNTMADKEDNAVIIESKRMENTTLGAPSKATSNAMMVVFMFLLPAAILAVGVVLWIRRRNR